MYVEDGNLIIEEEDYCLDCMGTTDIKPCPLLACIGQGLVQISGDDFVIKNCSWWKPKLELVK